MSCLAQLISEMKRNSTKSQEEHKRIFFSLKMLLATNKVILCALVVEGLGGRLRNRTELPLTYNSVNHEVTSFEGTPA